MSRRGWILFSSLGVIWGLPYLLIRIAVRDISPPALVMFRTIPACIVLLPFVARKANLVALRANWRAVLAFTVAEIGIPWVLLFRSEERITSSITGLLLAAAPLIAAILVWITRHEGSFGWQRLAGLGLGFVGVSVLVGFDIHGSNLLAVGEIGIVAVGYASGPLIVDRYLKDVSPIAVLATALLLTGIVYSPFALTDLPTRVSPEEIVAVALLVLACTDLAFLIFFKLIAEVGPAKATVVTYVNPAVALLVGVAILHEHFSLGVALGFPLILIGSFFGTGGLGRQATGGEEEAATVAPISVGGADPP